VTIGYAVGLLRRPDNGNWVVFSMAVGDTTPLLWTEEPNRVAAEVLRRAIAYFCARHGTNAPITLGLHAELQEQFPVAPLEASGVEAIRVAVARLVGEAAQAGVTEAMARGWVQGGQVATWEASIRGRTRGAEEDAHGH
jgi:hypothetical protein